ncbi:hypothetical protein [Caulobacter sp. LjRoot300]|uniref:hypothetical protein n=1 Tax=Caulobacter sp. LjRoot300 TaxID=3342321 RepID=UPI003ECE13A6
MGLYISHMETVSIKMDRSLYIYLLDYGWPGGEWEQLFKRHFMHMADRATQTGAVVVGSMNGIHFGNEVLSWHKVGDLNADDVLPGLLVTTTHPNYFRESTRDDAPAEPGLGDLLVIPLKPFCKDETDFLRAIEGIFSDLKGGLELKNFQIAKHDPRRHRALEVGKKIVNAIEAKPGAFGFSIDLKALLLPAK